MSDDPNFHKFDPKSGFFSEDAAGNRQRVHGTGKLPGASLHTEEIHPGDYVVLIEGDPYYVGNAPAIVEAFLEKKPGVVLMKQWIAFGEKLAAALGAPSAYEVTVKFAHAPQQAFKFWHIFLKKIEPPTVVRAS